MAITITLSAENYEIARAAASDAGLDVASFVNHAVQDYLETLREDAEDRAESERICADIDAGRMRTYPLESVEAELGL